MHGIWRLGRHHFSQTNTSSVKRQLPLQQSLWGHVNQWQAAEKTQHRGAQGCSSSQLSIPSLLYVDMRTDIESRHCTGDWRSEQKRYTIEKSEVQSVNMRRTNKSRSVSTLISRETWTTAACLWVHFTCAGVYPPQANIKPSPPLTAGPVLVWPIQVPSPHRAYFFTATREIRLDENLLRLVYASRVGTHLWVDFNWKHQFTPFTRRL